MDVVAMTVGMRVLVGSGHALEAFDVLLSKSTGNRWSRKPKRDIILVNAFISALVEHGWPSVVFPVWDALVPVLDVHPNAETLTSLLHAAREAEKADVSIRGALGHIVAYMPFRSAVAEEKGPDVMPKEQLASEIRSLLSNESEDPGSKKTKTVTSLWSGVPCGLKALAIFRSVVLRNYPQLRRISPPATAVWSDSAQTAHPLRDLAKGLGLGGKAAGDNRKDIEFVGSKATLHHVSSDHHPQISPNEKTFAAFIGLLGSQRRASEIPLTLAWMRELGIVPKNEIVCRALVLWAEVSLRGPLLEKYSSEYERLVRWLKDWLGAGGIPSEQQLSVAFRKLARERRDM